MVDEIQQYSAAEMERMMKVQDVLLKAMAKKITWWAAAEILGVTDRTMRRWRERLEEGDYAGLADRRKGKPSAKRIPVKTVEKVLGLYQETYYDLNIRHFHAKLREEHGIRLSNTWVQHSPQARGRSERSFGTWQGRLPQELRLAGISAVEEANAFLRERYIGEFNAKFSAPAAQKGTAFRRTGRSDLNWIFSVQTERVVDK